MAKVKITGHASGTGVLTVTAQNTSSDRTITLPDATGTLLNSDGDGSSLTGTSKIVQVVNVQDGEHGSGTTTIGLDDTIPQNTEGNEVMTLAVTPTNTNNILHIDVVVNMNTSLTAACLIALYQDTTAGALASALETVSGASHAGNIKFTHRMTAGTTSSTTFKVRGGLNTAGTFTYNGDGPYRRFGGTMASSITITEIAV